MFKQYRILIAPSIFLFILPFTQTVALRLSMLGIAFLTALYIWHKEEHPSLPLKLPLLLTALICSASLFWAVDPEYSFGEVKNEMGYTFLAFFTFFILTKSDKELRIFGGALLVGIVTMISLGLGAYLMNGKWNTVGYQGGTHDFSIYVVFMMPVLILAYFYTKRLYSRLAIIALAILLIITGYFTLQRIMWPGLAVVLLTIGVLLIFASPWTKTIKAISTLVVLFVCVSMLPIGLMAKNNTPYTSISAMYNVIKNDPRVDGIWGAAIVGIKQAPLLGVGYGRRGFVKAYPELQVDLGWHAHNIILDKAVQTGIIGAIIFTFLMACVIRQLWLGFRASQSREMLLLSVCSIAFVLAILTVNMTNHSFVRQVSLFFWSFLGMSLGYSLRQKQRNRSDPS